MRVEKEKILEKISLPPLSLHKKRGKNRRGEKVGGGIFRPAVLFTRLRKLRVKKEEKRDKERGREREEKRKGGRRKKKRSSSKGQKRKRSSFLLFARHAKKG